MERLSRCFDATPAERLAAAEAGDAAAQCVVAMALSERRGGGTATERNARARDHFRWLMLSAEQGFAHSQALLGSHFYNDSVIDGQEQKDYVQAARWFRRGAKQGSAMAAYGLAVCLECGHGELMNVEEARTWFAVAIDAGVPGAARDLRAMNKTEAENLRREAQCEEALSGRISMHELLPAHTRCAAEGCGARAASKCAACFAVRYCGAEHQRADWRRHKKDCATWAEARKAGAEAASAAAAGGGGAAAEAGAAAAAAAADAAAAAAAEAAAAAADEAEPEDPPPGTPLQGSPSEIQRLVKNMQLLLSSAALEQARGAWVLHITVSRFREDSPPYTEGIGLSLKGATSQDVKLAVQAWPRQCGSWEGAQWAVFTTALAAHLRIRPHSVLLQYKLQDRPRRAFVREFLHVLSVLQRAEPVGEGETHGWLSKLGGGGPLGMRMLLLWLSETVDRERGMDFALQFDLRHFRRGLGFGLRVADLSATPAAQYAVGFSSTIVRAHSGRVFKSVKAFLVHRVAEAERLPGFKLGGDAGFLRMLDALRGGPANAAAAEGRALRL